MKVRVQERFIKTGQYAEVEVYPAMYHPRVRREKYRPTSKAQEITNQRQAERRLKRLIHTNFTGDDFCCTFQYSDVYRPESLDEVKKDVKNFLRRLKRAYAKSGTELKYIYAVEEAKNRHIHIIINSNRADSFDEQRTALEKMWRFGYANVDRLQFTEYGVADLAAYIQKQHLEYRRWTSSKNLIKPEESAKKRFVNKKTQKEFCDDWNCQSFIEKLYPDYYLVLDESECVRNTTNGFDYVRLFLCRKDAKLSFYSTSLAENDDRIGTELKKRHKQTRFELYEDEAFQESLF